MYVVGMKAYDKRSNPVRNIYTFVKGPFFTLPEAQAVREDVSDYIFNNYVQAFPKGTSFLIKETEMETTIYQLVKGKRYPLITVSSLFFNAGDLENESHKVTKALQAEAYKQLATLSLT